MGKKRNVRPVAPAVPAPAAPKPSEVPKPVVVAKVQASTKSTTPSAATAADKIVQGQGAPASSASVKPTAIAAATVELTNVENELETPLEKLMTRAKDGDTVKQFVEAWETAFKAKMSLREQNLSPDKVRQEFDSMRQAKKLDSTLKKCTGFVKKIKNYTEAQKEGIEKDVSALNLSKYLGEISTAITEMKLKVTDIAPVIHICSAIHQRYAEFASLLLENVKKTLPQKKFDTGSGSLKKLTCDLRLVAELITVGVASVVEAFPLLLTSIRSLTTVESEKIQCIFVVISLVKGSGDSIAGILPARVNELVKENNLNLSRYDVVPIEKRLTLKKVLSDYYNSTSAAMVKAHEDVLKSEVYNRKLMRTRGEIPEDRMQVHSELQSLCSKLSIAVSKLADALNEKLPELRSLPPPAPEEVDDRCVGIDDDDSGAAVPGILIFEDEETRSFYQDLPDLKVYLPPVAYRDNVLSNAEEARKIEEREQEMTNMDAESIQAEIMEDQMLELMCEEGDLDQEEELPPSLKDDEDEEKNEEPSARQSLNEFLAGLLNCVTKEMIDRAAMEFASTFNSKYHRKSLARALFHIPRQRVDLIPLWSRLVAILVPVMPDIGFDLCAMLKSDFRFLVKKKHQSFIETKLKITRFICELVNFRVFPKADAFVCFKSLLMDFTRHHIEMACVFMETCGRFLHRSPESRRRMTIYLEEMMRKKTVSVTDPRYSVMVDHAYYYVCPREGVQRVIQKRKPAVAYLRNLILEELGKENLESTISIVRKFDWSNSKVMDSVLECLLQPWEVSSDQLRYLASFASGVLDIMPELKTILTDTVLEMVYSGMEKPQISENNKRISVMRYLGELYNYKLVGSTAIFSTLYALICYDVIIHSPTHWDHVDPPHDLMRVRLVCTLLRACGDYLNHGFSRKKLMCFLVYFQRYYWSKKESLVWNEQNAFPYAIEELMEDTVKWLRPRGKFPTNLAAASKEVEDLEAKMVKYAEELFHEAGASDGEVRDLDDGNQSGQPHGKQTTKARDVSSWVNDPSAGYMDPLDDDMGFALQDEPDPANNTLEYEEDEEFNQLCDKMCSETIHAVAREKMNTDISIPLKMRGAASAHSDQHGEENGKGKDDTVKFVLITRKGTKQTYKTLPVPSETDFVQNMHKREEDERLEKQKMKMLTLGFSKRQEAEEEQELLAKNNNRFNPLPAHGWKGNSSS